MKFWPHHTITLNFWLSFQNRKIIFQNWVLMLKNRYLICMEDHNGQILRFHHFQTYIPQIYSILKPFLPEMSILTSILEKVKVGHFECRRRLSKILFLLLSQKLILGCFCRFLINLTLYEIFANLAFSIFQNHNSYQNHLCSVWPVNFGL